MNHGEAKRRQAEEVTNILTLITVLITGQLTGNKGIAYVAVAVEGGAEAPNKVELLVLGWISSSKLSV